MNNLDLLIARVSALATWVGDLVQLRGFKAGGTAGQVPTKINGSDFNWSWQTPSGGGGGGTWGTITGTLSAQTDLQSALDAKVPTTRTVNGSPLSSNVTISTITGNAGTATALATGRTISVSGDLTYTSPTFDGSGNVTAAGTLATVNSNVGSFGSSTAIPVYTVNAKGLVTASSTAVVIAPAGTLTGTTLPVGITTATGLALSGTQISGGMFGAVVATNLTGTAPSLTAGDSTLSGGQAVGPTASPTFVAATIDTIFNDDLSSVDSIGFANGGIGKHIRFDVYGQQRAAIGQSYSIQTVALGFQTEGTAVNTGSAPYAAVTYLSPGLLGIAANSYWSSGGPAYGGSLKLTNLEAVGTLAVTGSSTLTGGLIPGTFTVGTFPTTTYLTAIVTDALTPIVGAAVSAGGSAKCWVTYNGSAKIVIATL